MFNCSHIWVAISASHNIIAKTHWAVRRFFSCEWKLWNLRLHTNIWIADIERKQSAQDDIIVNLNWKYLNEEPSRGRFAHVPGVYRFTQAIPLSQFSFSCCELYTRDVWQWRIYVVRYLIKFKTSSGLLTLSKWMMLKLKVTQIHLNINWWKTDNYFIYKFLTTNELFLGSHIEWF